MKTLAERIQTIIDNHPITPSTPMILVDIIKDLQDALNENEKHMYDWTKGTFKDLTGTYTDDEEWIRFVQG